MPRRAGLALIGAAAVLALSLGGAPAEAPRAELMGAFRWRGEGPAFGGFSGIDLAADGSTFVAISDRGSIAEGRILRDDAGNISGVELARFAALKGADDQPIRQRIADAEGLDLRPDGGLYLSFEGWSRVEYLDRPDATPQRLPIAAEFRGFQPNSGPEALAVDAAGAVYLIPERSGAMGRPFPVYRFDGTRWSVAFELPREGDWLPVGADFDDRGRLYVLQRDFRGILGFASRLVRLVPPAGGIAEVDELFQTPPGRHDNLEGLAVWRDGAGHLRATMVADDNFALLQRTELVEYRLPE